MVELFHRRFAPERHPEREARELFAKTPDGAPPLPEGMNLESLMQPESRVPGSIQEGTRRNIRAMAADPHSGAHPPEAPHAGADAHGHGVAGGGHDAHHGADAHGHADEHGENAMPKKGPVAEQVKEVISIAGEIKELVPKVREAVRASGGENMNIVRDNALRLDQQTTKMGILYDLADAIEDFKGAKIPPDRFVDVMTQFYQSGETHGDSTSIVKNMKAAKAAHASDIAKWDMLSHATQLTIAASIIQAAQAEERLKEIEEQAKFDKKQFEKFRDSLRKLQPQDAQESQGETHHVSHGMGSYRGYFEGVGMRLYTVKEIFMAFDKLKHAYEHAWEEKKGLEAATLAKHINGAIKWAPYGGEADLELTKGVEGEFNKISNEWKEHLETNNVSWKQLFADHGAYSVGHLLAGGEKQKAKGAIEYAASRGWLYDIDKSIASDWTEMKVQGFRLMDVAPPGWEEAQVKNFYTQLRGKNSSGREEEINKTYARIKDIERPPFFVEEIERELEKNNLWAVVGIAKRAMERGLWGEISPWITTTVLRALRQNPHVRKSADRVFLDQLGGLGLYRSSFILGVFKGKRGEFESWLAKGETDIEKGDLFIGPIVKKIEHDIMHNSRRHFSTSNPKDMRDLDFAVAWVLSGNPLNEAAQKSGQFTKLGIDLQLNSGVTISIFDDQYSSYRNDKYFEYQLTLMPGVKEEDPDYYTNRNENRYVGRAVVRQIFERKGQGAFAEEPKTANYAGDIITIYKELLDQGKKGSAENHRREMGRKLTEWILDPLGDSRAPGLEKVLIKRAEGDTYHVDRKPIIGTLLEEGFIDVRVIIQKYFEGGGGDVFARLLLEESARKNTTRSDTLFRLEAAKKKYTSASNAGEKSAATLEAARLGDEWASTLPKVTWEAVTGKKDEGGSHADAEHALAA